MLVFVPSLKTIDKDKLFLLKKGTGVPVRDISTVLFSTEEKARDFLTQKLSELYEYEDIVAISINEVELDNPESDICYRFYDKNLQFQSEYFDFLDRDISNPKYEQGDWVLFLYGEELLCGRIGDTPSDGEPYYVLFEDTNVNDCSPHAHLDELFIVRKIDEKEAERLLPRKYFENIKLRFNVFK